MFSNITRKMNNVCIFSHDQFAHNKTVSYIIYFMKPLIKYNVGNNLFLIATALLHTAVSAKALIRNV